MSFSIGIPAFNALTYLKTTLDSVVKNTENLGEIIIIDDGSDQATKDFLKTLKDVTVVTNPVQKGFPFSCNKILRLSKFDKICILNSDVYTPYHWDNLLYKFLNIDDCIVGPSTSRISGPQQLDDIYPFAKMLLPDEIEKCAREVYSQFKLEAQNIATIGGFCYCLTKGVFQKVGFFDERFGLGSFEETDYSLRAKKLGIPSVWVKGAYVHHFGKASFRAYDYKTLWKKNEAIFQQKCAGKICGEQVDQ